MKASFLPSRAAKGYNLINKFIKMHLKADWVPCPTAAGAHPLCSSLKLFIDSLSSFVLVAILSFALFISDLS